VVTLAKELFKKSNSSSSAVKVTGKNVTAYWHSFHIQSIAPATAKSFCFGTWNNMELTWKISQLNKNSYSTHQFFKQLRKFVLRAI